MVVGAVERVMEFVKEMKMEQMAELEGMAFKQILMFR